MHTWQEEPGKSVNFPLASEWFPKVCACRTVLLLTVVARLLGVTLFAYQPQDFCAANIPYPFFQFVFFSASALFRSSRRQRLLTLLRMGRVKLDGLQVFSGIRPNMRVWTINEIYWLRYWQRAVFRILNGIRLLSVLLKKMILERLDAWEAVYE